MKVYRCNAKLLRSRFVVQTALIFIIYFFLALWYTADVEPAITQRKDLSEAAVSLPGSSDPATVFKTGILGDFEPSKSEKRFGYKGEIGEAVHVDMQIDEVKTAMHDYGYNSYVSDMIPLNRSIPDMRQDECQFWHYPESLPNASVVIAFHNEAWSPLLRTVHSVLNRSPSYLLEEIILVDDFSDKEHLGLRLDGYVQKLNGKVKILRNRAREGLIRTRTIGAQHAQGAVIIFLDAHCEVGINWLPPLLAPIRRNWKVMTVPIIDGIDQTTWRYSSVYGRRDVHYSGIFEWGLLYKEILINEKEMSGRTHDSEPFRSPTHAGGLFAISAKWFKNLGYYDPGLQIWGGEQYELSFKIWRCGGGILFVPCSHVGHVYRTHMPYNFGNLSGHPVIAQNLVRVVKIWMDEYASYYFIREPSAAQLSPGEISFQLRLKQLLKCHSFRWYMENVASDVLKSYPLLPNNLEWGEARNPDTNKCIDLGNKAIPAEMSVLPCHGLGGHQILRINVKGQLAQGEWCIMPRYNKLVADHCMKGKVDGPFEYDLKTQQIIYKTRFTCVTMSQFDDNDSLKLEECDRSNMYQRWLNTTMEGGFVESFPFFAWPVGFLIVFVIALRFYFKGAKFSERVKGKNMVAVVSGCNCGIGKQVARELNLRGLKVYMLCRDEDRARMAIVELIKLGCDPDRLIFKQLDLAKFSTVHKAAEEIAQDEEKVDLLINNAGVFMYPKFKLTDDGHELVWQTNYLGHFLLTELLLPLLSKAPLARIVNVSAATHYHSDPLDLQFVDRRDGWDSRQSYAKSKLALVMHVCGLTVRLRGDHVPNITINSCHPGASYTRLFRHTPLAWKLISSICAPIMWYFLKTPKDAAQVVLHLALSKKVQGVSGGYFSGFNIKEPLSMEDWDKCCKELYEYSLETCGLHR